MADVAITFCRISLTRQQEPNPPTLKRLKVDQQPKDLENLEFSIAFRGHYSIKLHYIYPIIGDNEMTLLAINFTVSKSRHRWKTTELK